MILMAVNVAPWAAWAAGEAELNHRIAELVAEFETELSAPQIEPEELIAQQKVPDPGLVFVDVRTSAERQVSTLPGALDLEEWERRIAVGSRQERVVFYCTIGYRSSLEVIRNAPVLADQGARALNLRGGILRWIASGGEVVDQGGHITRQVHVFGKHWNALPAGYVAQEYGSLRLLWEKILWRLKAG